jgi:hypothetical protein
LNGFPSVPNALWHLETPKLIEADLALLQLFKNSVVVAKRENGK